MATEIFLALFFCKRKMQAICWSLVMREDARILQGAFLILKNRCVAWRWGARHIWFLYMLVKVQKSAASTQSWTWPHRFALLFFGFKLWVQYQNRGHMTLVMLMAISVYILDKILISWNFVIILVFTMICISENAHMTLWFPVIPC